MKRARVIKAYRSAYPSPIREKAGAEVSVEDRETDWPDWLWCRTKDGVEGWIPESYVERNGNAGRLVRDYEELEVLDAASSWLVCRRDNGEVGWLPAENVRLD